MSRGISRISFSFQALSKILKLSRATQISETQTQLPRFLPEIPGLKHFSQLSSPGWTDHGGTRTSNAPGFISHPSCGAALSITPSACSPLLSPSLSMRTHTLTLTVTGIHPPSPAAATPGPLLTRTVTQIHPAHTASRFYHNTRPDLSEAPHQGDTTQNQELNKTQKLEFQRRQRWQHQQQQKQQEASRTQLLYLSALVLGMVGLSYASVPLYRMFCQATGFGGTTQRKEGVEQKLGGKRKGDGTGEEGSDSEGEAAAKAASKRQLVIHFNGDVADGLPWKFTPCQKELKLRPGQSTLAFYTAHNTSKEPITGVSTYNVSPMKAGIYFNKIQCFCFEEQRLLPGEKIDMPVFFYIDPEFAVDPNMDDITNLTLSYTFFKVT